MKVKIFKPAKNAMQSGKANTKKWFLEILPDEERFIEPIMGWTGSADTNQQFRLKFASKEEAIAYAERKGFAYEVIEPNQPSVHIQSYSDNFTG